MAEAINCPSCGAANQLPEGKSNMFCAFCGNAIAKLSTKNENKPKLKKSKIIRCALAFIDRNVERLDEVISLYSDSEIDSIADLDLSNNKITTLKGLSRFTSCDINFSGNNLEYIDDLPVFGSKVREMTKGVSINFNFSNNTNLKGFTENACDILDKYIDNYTFIDIYVHGCPNFNYESISKVFSKTDLNADTNIMFREQNSNLEIPVSLKEFGFKKHITSDAKISNWCLDLKNPHKNQTESSKENNNQPSFGKVLGNELSGGKCFIATATMGSYNHPTVMELRHFRDNWILKKSWGEGFVEWYYYYGAKAAKVIEKSFFLKKFCFIVIVKPLYVFSKFVKKTS